MLLVAIEWKPSFRIEIIEWSCHVRTGNIFHNIIWQEKITWYVLISLQFHLFKTLVHKMFLAKTSEWGFYKPSDFRFWHCMLTYFRLWGSSMHCATPQGYGVGLKLLYLFLSGFLSTAKQGDNALSNVRPFVCGSVCLSELSCLNRLTWDITGCLSVSVIRVVYMDNRTDAVDLLLIYF